MPNHVTSRCTITGPANDVARFREMMIVTKMEERGEHWPADREPKEYTEFNFNAIIPMPEILRNETADSTHEMGAAMILYRGDRGAPYADHAQFWSKRVRDELCMSEANISDVAAVYLARKPEVEQAGRNRLQAVLETGYVNWYPWSIANWGTKWGAYQFSEITAEPLTIEFQTAWSFPTPVFEKLATAFPALTFDCLCFDEDWNFAGVGAFGVTDSPFEIVKATDELYERVYGRKPEHDEEDEVA